jgi:hypothetical protein
MSDRDYYSARTGKIKKEGIGIDVFRTLFYNLLVELEEEELFKEHFPDMNELYEGKKLEKEFLLKIRRTGLLPIKQCLSFYSEEDCFDIIEFFYDHCSEKEDLYADEFFMLGAIIINH